MFLRTGKIQKDKVWVEFILNFFIVQGFFKIKTSDQLGLTSVQRECREKMVSSLSFLKRVSFDSDGNRANNQGENAGKMWALYMLETIEKYNNDSQFEFIVELDQQVVAATKKAMEITLEIQSKIASFKNNASLVEELNGFLSLFTHMALFLYTGLEESAEIIQDLEHCYKLLIPIEEKSTKKKRKLEPEPLPPVDVLTDVLISFLAKPSQVLRNLANDLFAIFAPKATESVLEILFDVLNAKQGVEGADELFEQAGSNSEDDSLSTTDEDEQEQDETDDDDENTAVDQELKEKIEQALKNEGQEELEDLNDEEMESFDQKLAEIFGQRKALKKMKKGNHLSNIRNQGECPPFQASSFGPARYFY